MAKTFTLQPLLHLAKQKNETATKKLGQLNRSEQSAISKLDMLKQYRKDYQGKMQQAEQDGMGLHDLCNFRDFIYRLDDAITQQNAVVIQAQNSVQSGLGTLSDTQRRMKSYDTLAQRHVESEKKIETKREQQIMDEHNGRHAAYNNAEHSEDN